MEMKFIKLCLLALVICSINMCFAYENGTKYGHCSCSCDEENAVMCTSVNTDDCNSLCIERCKLSIHTLNKNSSCDDELNCTCVMTTENAPVCSQSRKTHVEMTFANYREMECHNVCHNNEYEVVYTRRCDPANYTDIYDLMSEESTASDSLGDPMPWPCV